MGAAKSLMLTRTYNFAFFDGFDKYFECNYNVITM